MWKAASLRSRSKANRKTGKARPLRRAFSFEPLSSPGPEQGRPHDERACRRSRGSPANAPAILRGARPGPRPAVVLAPPCAWRGLAATSRRGVALGAELAWPSPENRDSRHRPTRPPIPLVSLLKRALGRRFLCATQQGGKSARRAERFKKPRSLQASVFIALLAVILRCKINKSCRSGHGNFCHYIGDKVTVVRPPKKDDEAASRERPRVL